MNRKAYIYIKSLSLILLSLAQFACTDEIVTSPTDHEGSDIAFSVTNGNDWTHGSRSAEDNSVHDPFGIALNVRDSIYIHSDVSVHKLNISDSPKSRGVIYNGSNTDELGGININCYLDDEGNSPYFKDYEITPSDGPESIWTGSPKKFWLNNGEKLHFYASANIPDGISISETAATTTMSYTVPHSGDGINDALAQPDILFGYTEASKESVKDSHGNVELFIHHAFAAINFQVGDITKGKIKTITIHNARKSGKMTFTGTPESNKDKISWDADADLVSFTQTFDVDVDDNYTPDEDFISQPVTDNVHGATFMLIPQDIETDEVYFEVNMVIGEGSDAKTVCLTAPAFKVGGITQWEAGKLYTYTLSSSSVNWTYVFEVSKNSLNFKGGEQDGQCTVLSYRYRTGNKSVKEPVEWIAIDMGARDHTSTSDRKNWIHEMIDSGKGSTNDPEEWNITINPNRLLYTEWIDSDGYNGDDVMRANPIRGSVDDPWDLSVKTYDGKSMARSTANCYVINSGGTYCFPVVYGNSYNNGMDNTVAYSHKHAMDVTGGTPQIDGVVDAKILWMDALGFISDVDYDSENKRVIFTVEQEQLQQANAVIGVFNDKDEILWSWHIWAFDKNVWTESITIDDFDDPNIKYQLMNNNLGRCDAKNIYYDGRSGQIEFRQIKQKGNGDDIPDVYANTSTLDITLEGFNQSYYDINSTVYQWGRKDPFTAYIVTRPGVMEKRGYKTLYPLSSPYRIADSFPEDIKRGITIRESIQKPYRLTRNSLKEDSWMDDMNIYAWNSLEMEQRDNGRNLEKTVFDPCPAGFKVPNYATFKIVSLRGINRPINGKWLGDPNPTGEETEAIPKPSGNVKAASDWLESCLNGDIVHKDPDSYALSDMRHFRLYTVKDGSGDDPTFDMFSTGIRPVSGTLANYNCVTVWTGGLAEENLNNAYSFTIGYAGFYVLQARYPNSQATLCPVRPILEFELNIGN